MMCRIRESVVGLGFFIAVLITPLGLTWGQDAQNDQAPAVQEGCESLRNQRREACEQAAKLCKDVDQYDAFNQIRACAHYAQACHNTGLRADEVCFPKPNGRLTLQQR